MTPNCLLSRRCFRYVESRVAREEPGRQQFESSAMTGHHRPLFGTRNMSHPERVPQNNILIVERTIGRRELLVLIVRRRPQVLVNKSRTFSDRRCWRGVRD